MTAFHAIVAAFVLLLSPVARAQEAVVAAPDHAALLASDDAVLAANKRLVYDFWREVFEGRHLELADRYLAQDYVQHNPNVPTGRAGFVAFFAAFGPPRPIADAVRAPLVSIVAERDLVTLVFVRELPDPADPGRSYTTTAFDLFRVADGKIVEHWDAATRP